MSSREQFTLDVHKTPPAQNVLLGYSANGTAVYSGSGGGGGGSPAAASASAAATVPHNVNVGGTVKRKRGRPRKYGPNGAMTLSLTPPVPPATIPQSAGTFSPPLQPPPPSVPLGGSGGGSESHSSLKKVRGRPPGSSKKQQMEALGNFIVFLYNTSSFSVHAQCCLGLQLGLFMRVEYWIGLSCWLVVGFHQTVTLTV